jgi:hypothetical protein
MLALARHDERMDEHVDADTRLWADLWDQYREHRRRPEHEKAPPTLARVDGAPEDRAVRGEQ